MRMTLPSNSTALDQILQNTQRNGISAGRWANFPLLVDGERNVVETSIIIEYLQLAHPGSVRLLPTDVMQALDIRFLDSFFDLHIMTPVQHAVGAALTGDTVKRQEGLAHTASKLDLAYAWLESHPDIATWATGESFTLADCAAAAFTFICRLDSADRRKIPKIAHLLQPLAVPPIIRTGSGRSAALPAVISSWGAG